MIDSFKYTFYLLLLMFSNAIYSQITVTDITDFDFGKFTKNTSGSITISAAGIRSVTGGVYALSSSHTSAALIEVKQVSTNIINITYSDSTLTNGTTTLTLTVGPTDQPNDVLSPTGGNIPDDVYIGCTLNITSNATSGTYTGTFDVIFTAN
ncbi:MAG: DUF4402 domain-containing protein [Flavobacteriaceae bacterium]|nr:DUF4402 domain-containing protein [Flavobacteriaceae bacterium]